MIYEKVGYPSLTQINIDGLIPDVISSELRVGIVEVHSRRFCPQEIPISTASTASSITFCA
jgi:hypothetical protein